MNQKRDYKQDEKDITAAVQVLEESKSAVTVKAVSELSDIPKTFIYKYVQYKMFPICSKFIVQKSGRTGYKQKKKQEVETLNENFIVLHSEEEETREKSINEHIAFLEDAFSTGRAFSFDDLQDEATEVIEHYDRSSFIQAFHRLEAEKHIKPSSPLSDRYITTHEPRPKAPPVDLVKPETITEPVALVVAETPTDRTPVEVKWPLDNGGYLQVVLPGSYEQLTESEYQEIAEVFELITRHAAKHCIKNTTTKHGDKV